MTFTPKWFYLNYLLSSIFFIFFQLCYNAGIPFKIIIIVYYSFVFAHGLFFTFTIFPKDLPEGIQREMVFCENHEENSRMKNTETETNGLLLRSVEECDADKTGKHEKSDNDGGKKSFFHRI